MARVSPLLACYPNGPNSAHGKSRPVSGQPVLYSGPLTTRYACDRIKLLQSYGLLMARYRVGPISITPDYGPCRPIYPMARGPPITRPFIDGPRPTDYMPIYRRPIGYPWILWP
ncbi:hypothetical protein PSTG_19865, partial [Puccinia striiformis f. sp. tritici PST-78]